MHEEWTRAPNPLFSASSNRSARLDLKFTEDEWNALEKGVIGAGMFVSVSESDFTHTISDANALAAYMTGQRETSRSELVRLSALLLTSSLSSDR